jgi:hypothetical protein
MPEASHAASMRVTEVPRFAAISWSLFRVSIGTTIETTVCPVGIAISDISYFAHSPARRWI